MALLRSFYLPQKIVPEKEIILDPAESLHLIKVRRAKKDEMISVFDGRQNEWLCTIEDFSPKHAKLKILEHKTVAPSPHSITLLQALPKGKIMDGIIQKATEIGVTQVIIFPAEHSEGSLTPAQYQVKKEKWHTIAIESCKQCGMSIVPEIRFAKNLSMVLSETDDQALKLIASLEKNAFSLRSTLNHFLKKNKCSPKKNCWLIGPEGDFSFCEYDLAAKAGFQPISLGSNVLRVETAAVVSLGLLVNELRELKNSTSVLS